MADYCKQCSIELFGADFKDLVHTDPVMLAEMTEAYAAGKAPIVICEGCGHIQVDPDGRCISPDCYASDGTKHGTKYA